MFVLLVVILIILLILAQMSDRACNVGSVPPTEDNDIDGCLMHYVTTTNDPFDYGSYNALNRSKAVIAEGLLQSSELIVGLFNVQPQGRFCPEQLKRRICIAEPTCTDISQATNGVRAEAESRTTR